MEHEFAGGDVVSLVRLVKEASTPLSAAPAALKNKALEAVAAALTQHAAELLAANGEDMREAEAAGLSAPLLKRLRFDEAKLRDVVDGIRSLIALPDPIGRTTLATELDEGLELYRVTCPLGVVGIIFEARPDALVQISALCLKSGNAALLKGGREARRTNRALFSVIYEAAVAAGLPPHWAGLLESRAEVEEILKLDDYIDLIVPRGSNAFVRHIMDNSRIPVMGHADGICHLYVDRTADIAMAARLVCDSKTQYAAVCNALETLLVHGDIAAALPAIKAELDKKGVTLYGCARTRALIDACPAGERTYDTEYLDYSLSVKIVDSLDEAIAHINRHGSGHTDAIVTEDRGAAAKFLALVDSADVLWNCSTRFSDGFRYGFGAEVGISTSKLHARGPVGLEGLTSYKYKLLGHGQTVAEYAGHERRFTHRPLDGSCPV